MFDSSSDKNTAKRKYEEPRVTLFQLMAFAEWVEDIGSSPDMTFEDFGFKRDVTQGNKMVRIIAQLEGYSGDFLVKRKLKRKGGATYSTRKSAEKLEPKSLERTKELTELGVLWAGFGAMVTAQCVNCRLELTRGCH